ncbi:acyl-homoserine-lactone synthase [Microvirga antarctica]|uniref:acyl-homoserine-lactone synthase n=1 Tax=Microvirga antarctica TaxID=2819233 RepID=UPI001B30A1A5|nr:acyl-homoserine-lactone synthase [Microvirga antarctica]
MTLVHVVTSRNRTQYKEQMSQYFRIRHEIFVEERGWEQLRRADGVERDQYDNAQAIYLLALDNGRVVGGQRLYPTLLPHMMSDVFANLATRGVPRSESIFECTRYFVVKERRTGRTDCRLLAAMQEYCLSAGITDITAVVEMWWMPRWHQIGFKVRPLGLPAVIENEPCMAAQIAISRESLEQVRRVGGLRGPSLLQEKRHPANERMPHVAA